MRYNEEQDPLIEWAPAQDAVLAERPLRVQLLLEVDEVTSLPQTHFVGKAGKLVKVRRIVGHAPNARLREIV